jgi:hypothetical protein
MKWCSACRVEVDDAREKCPRCLRRSTLVAGKAAAPAANAIEIRLSVKWWIVLALGGPLSLGLVWVLAPFVVRRWPRRIERDTVTTRDGRVMPWSALTDAVRVQSRYFTQYRLTFGTEEVVFVLGSIAPARELEQRIEREIDARLARRG